MYHTLSKADKKVARACIDKGLDAEYRGALATCERIINNLHKGKIPTARDAYMKVYKSLITKDKAIGRRYEKGGSHWLMMVCEILYDGYISESDIEGFSEETKARIKGIVEGWKES